MFHSGEIRWFFKEPLPDDMRDWFDANGRAKHEAPRTDEYLLLPHCAAAGVKVREGNLEIKASTRHPDPVTYADDVGGYRDAWVKWSCKAEDENALRTMLGASADRWAFVRKRRYVRLYSLDKGKPVEADAATDRLERGCQVEITSLKRVVGDFDDAPTASEWSAASPWWSLSLEAFAPVSAGVTDEVLAHLDEAATQFFRDQPPCSLDPAASRSYPAWLLGLA